MFKSLFLVAKPTSEVQSPRFTAIRWQMPYIYYHSFFILEFPFYFTEFQLSKIYFHLVDEGKEKSF